MKEWSDFFSATSEAVSHARRYLPTPAPPEGHLPWLGDRCTHARPAGGLGAATIGETSAFGDLELTACVHPLQDGFLVSQVLAWDPRYLVIDEHALHEAPWRRFLTRDGAARGELAELLTLCRERSIDVMVLATLDGERVAAFPNVSYLPNQRVERYLRALAVPDPMLEALERAGGVGTGERP